MKKHHRKFFSDFGHAIFLLSVPTLAFRKDGILLVLFHAALGCYTVSIAFNRLDNFRFRTDRLSVAIGICQEHLNFFTNL